MQVPRHQCLIYQGSPVTHLADIAAVVAEKLRSNFRCLYLNSPTMVAGLRSYLAAAGVDVAAAVKNGALLLSSETIEPFDIAEMIAMLSNAVEHAVEDGYVGLFASGDMTWEFGRAKNFSKLLEYEYALEDLFQRQPALYGVCQYHRDTLPSEAASHALYSHGAVYINQTLSRLNPHFRPRHSLPDPLPEICPGEINQILD